jgi:GntR family transcriptional regulator/MocR family aminotransferase
MGRSATKRMRGLALMREDDIPLYRQIYEHIRTSITAGQLRPGDRVPSTRSLAERFGTARGTVDAAYAILTGEGYLIDRGPAGTMVSAGLDSRAIASVTSRARLLSSAPRPAARAPRPFRWGCPLWTRSRVRSGRVW